MGVTEVTVGQFNKFAVATGFREYAEKSAKESNLLTYFSPGYAVTDDSPAAVVSWSDAQAYCKPGFPR